MMDGTGDMLTRTRNEDTIQAVLLDQPVEVDVGEDLAGIRTPVT